MAFYYDPQTSILRTALRVGNTVLPHVFCRYEFWSFLLLNLTLFVFFNLGYLDKATDKTSNMHMDWNNVKVITGLTTFFEVFYTNQCFDRYVKLHDGSRRVLGAMHDFAFDARIWLNEKASNHAWLAVRYSLLSVIVFFTERRGDMDDSTWSRLVAGGFVTTQERSFLQPLSQEQRSAVLIHWSADVAHEGIKAAKAPSNVMKSFLLRLEHMRAWQQEVTDKVNLPIPFQYFHLLNVMVCVNAFAWAYIMGTTESFFAPVVFYCALVIFMGMMELGSQLSNPFGTDDVDFPVKSWVNEYIDIVGCMMSSDFFESDSHMQQLLDNPLIFSHVLPSSVQSRSALQKARRDAPPPEANGAQLPPPLQSRRSLQGNPKERNGPEAIGPQGYRLLHDGPIVHRVTPGPPWRMLSETRQVSLW